MTNRIEQQRYRRRATQVVLFIAFALLGLSRPEGVSAQWVTNAGNTTTTNNVGIGTESPRYPLTVMTNAIVAPLNLIGGTGSIEIWKDANPFPSKAVAFGAAVPGYAAGENIHLSTYSGSAWSSRVTVLNSNGNVGIGTTNPEASLHIYKANTGGTGATLALMNNAAAVGNATALTFADGNVAEGARAQIKTITEADPFHGAMTFLTGLRLGNLTERMRISGNGNVGVGTIAPASKLHVAGDIRVDGNISAKYQDVAEWVPSTQKLAAGTVVVLDVERNNHVTTTSTPYDMRVAGVVSAQPGITLGEAGEGKALIATTGRVKVKVDASRGAIRVGDLLVTGDTPGVAMRSQPLDLGGVPIHRPGTLIGKALESLEKGTGEILVLLSLQ